MNQIKKPMNVIDNLNRDPLAVEITNERRTSNKNLSNKLKQLGKLMQNELDPAQRDNFEYAGSVVTHFYVGKQLADEKSVTLIHDSAWDTMVSEKVMSMGISDLALHLMQTLFGRKKAATRDKRDKRLVN